MADTPDISKAVEKAIAESLDAHIAALRAELVDKINAATAPILEELAKSSDRAGKKEEHAPGTGPTDILNAAVASIYDAPGQGDILKALLDGLAQFAARSALFVVKGGSIAAWQARGFEKDIKGFTADTSAGLAGRAIRDKEPVNAAAAEFDARFISTHGNPSDGNCCLLPIVVREKVVAVVYVDAGTEADGHADESASRVLVRSTASWLELIALRKSAAGAAPAEAQEPPPSPPAKEEQEPAPKAAEPPAPPPTPAVEPPKAMAAAAGPDLSSLSKEDQEVHKKAKRFAKLLVDEIKLYNKAKVEEGRQNKDIYKRLQEDIDKSRSTYEKRYSKTAAGSADYFNSEVIRILADNDVSLLGADFSQ
jgi:hypothetical protein